MGKGADGGSGGSMKGAGKLGLIEFLEFLYLEIRISWEYTRDITNHIIGI